MRKITCISLILSTTFLLTVGCTPKQREDKKPLKIAMNIYPGIAHVFVAKEKGIFRKDIVSMWN